MVFIGHLGRMGGNMDKAGFYGNKRVLRACGIGNGYSTAETSSPLD